ncbi:hypothetical protein C942_02567 [Photobacterium marinum]|uniref:Uncharacterized protein n=1 Tax=Photobacterium marinum TaxID=1056511 RepID=L8J876_9GAMM|nr:hypothetical protein C942_02567 [Photobacterium marinum]
MRIVIVDLSFAHLKLEMHATLKHFDGFSVSLLFGFLNKCLFLLVISSLAFQ